MTDVIRTESLFSTVDIEWVFEVARMDLWQDAHQRLGSPTNGLCGVETTLRVLCINDVINRVEEACQNCAISAAIDDADAGNQ